MNTMMSNIKELYKLAGVNKTNVTCDYCELKCYDCTKTPCPVDYPPFTAEKQLELIKWLATKQEKFTILYDSDYGYTCEVVNINNCYESFSYYELIQALCNLTIGLWDELSSEQRTEVRGILQ